MALRCTGTIDRKGTRTCRGDATALVNDRPSCDFHISLIAHEAGIVPAKIEPLFECDACHHSVAISEVYPTAIGSICVLCYDDAMFHPDPEPETVEMEVAS